MIAATRPGFALALSSIEAVIFDAGNTLVFLDPHPVGEAYRTAGVEFEADRFQVAERTARLELTARVSLGHDGTEPDLWRIYFQRILELTDVPSSLTEDVSREMRDAHQRRHLWTYAPHDVTAALDRLLEMGLRLAVVSNADGRMEEAIRLAGIRDRLEFVIDSGDVGVSKPDPAIFELAAGALALPPDRCLYVGDLYPVDVVGARRAGMQAVLVDPDEKARSLPVDRIRNVGDLPAFLKRSAA